MANAILSGDMPQYQAAVHEAQKRTKRIKQAKNSGSKGSTKFDDLSKQDKDELLKVLFLNAGLIAAD